MMRLRRSPECEVSVTALGPERLLSHLDQLCSQMVSLPWILHLAAVGGGHCQKEQSKIHLAEPWDNESKLPRINPKEP